MTKVYSKPLNWTCLGPGHHILFMTPLACWVVEADNVETRDNGSIIMRGAPVCKSSGTLCRSMYANRFCGVASLLLVSLVIPSSIVLLLDGFACVRRVRQPGIVGNVQCFIAARSASPRKSVCCLDLRGVFDVVTSATSANLDVC